MSKTLLTIESLTYEEVILLQENVMYMNDNGIPFNYDVKTFDPFYEKVINP
jgi:hypothetical protein